MHLFYNVVENARFTDGSAHYKQVLFGIIHI